MKAGLLIIVALEIFLVSKTWTKDLETDLVTSKSDEESQDYDESSESDYSVVLKEKTHNLELRKNRRLLSVHDAIARTGIEETNGLKTQVNESNKQENLTTKRKKSGTERKKKSKKRKKKARKSKKKVTEKKKKSRKGKKKSTKLSENGKEKVESTGKNNKGKGKKQKKTKNKEKKCLNKNENEKDFQAVHEIVDTLCNKESKDSYTKWSCADEVVLEKLCLTNEERKQVAEDSSVKAEPEPQHFVITGFEPNEEDTLLK